MPKTDNLSRHRLSSQFSESVVMCRMAKKSGGSFSRRVPDFVTEELVGAFSRNASYEFKPLFELVYSNLKERNAASGGEEMLRLRTYEKLQNLVGQGAVKKTINGYGKKYQGVTLALKELAFQLKEIRASANKPYVAAPVKN